MERNEWLKGLKAGDVVVSKQTSNLTGEEYYQSYKIKKITPKGQIRLDNDILLDANGYYHKHERFSSGRTILIEPLTDEIIAYEKNRREKIKLVQEVKTLLAQANSSCSGWSIEKLKKIKELLE